MKKVFILPSFMVLFLSVLLSGCGSGKGETNGVLKQKKDEMAKLVKQQDEINSKITALQVEINKLDPNGAALKEKLVALDTVQRSEFEHYIDLQGKVDAQNVAYVAPNGQGGVVKEVFVKQGDAVSKGDALLKLDDASVRQNVVAAKQQVAGMEAQLQQAKTVFERQQNLWKENIGTELQVLNAKTAQENLQSQYNAAKANLQIAQEQLNNTTVRAGISGVLNTFNIKVGEFFSAGTQVQIVNNANLKVTVDVPENYSGSVAKGSLIRITLPDVGNKRIVSHVSVLGKLIDPVSRTFYIEGKVPESGQIRPNQVAMVQIKDYTSKDAVAIPANTVQNDEKGKYVMVAHTEKGKAIAKKRYVTIGKMYRDRLEILTGLDKGDVIVSDGFQNLYDGQPIVTGL